MLNPAYARALAWILIGLAPIILVLLFRITAPYGRHGRGGWGPSLPTRWGWVLMETPSVALMAAGVWVLGLEPGSVASVAAAAWLLHYAHRSWRYPFTLPSHRSMPIVIAAMGAAFNVANASANAALLPPSAPWSPTVIAGFIAFVLGFGINRWSDAHLRKLRAAADGAYVLPESGLYRWIANPNYLGELLMWVGWAIAVQTVAAWAFVLFTAANLIPRAVAHLHWYRRTFADYPPSRRAWLPGLW